MTDRRYIVESVIDSDTHRVTYNVVDIVANVTVAEEFASRGRAEEVAREEEDRFDADIAAR